MQNRSKERRYVFDVAFSKEATNVEVYRSTCSHLARPAHHVLQGYRSTCPRPAHHVLQGYRSTCPQLALLVGGRS